MTKIGMMQGRLVPPVDNTIFHFPRDTWDKEFALAEQAGIDCIEWIYDVFAQDVNPLNTDEGIDRINTLARENNVQTPSLCANYFMEKLLIRVSPPELEENVNALYWLLRQSVKIGVKRMVLPFLDASRIETEQEFQDVKTLMKRITPVAEETGIAILLECSLEPQKLADLISGLSPAYFQVNYDTGNSTSLGYDPQVEFKAYGHRIGGVHVKDRLLGNGTVPLGTGNTDFALTSKLLKEVEFQGNFVLEAARGNSGDELAWARKNRAFIEDNFMKA
jgi:L-ribulose-5-phosphate 3-epimerase